MTQKHHIVSLFSGCGGLDLGFQGGFSFLGKKYSKNPFEIVWANELNPEACKTYRANLRHDIIEGDIWDSLSNLPSTCDVLLGGFPCQDISINNIRAKGIKGKRSGLYKAMVEAIRLTQPKVFVAENVRALLFKNNEYSLRKLKRDFSSLGYRLNIDLYNVADYGVPQTRERVLIVGYRQGVFYPPVPVLTKSHWVSAEKAISDLENLGRDERNVHFWSCAQKSPEQGSRRLKPDRPGYTIRAECHGNIQFHYNLDRRISMREAARLQSFPDDFQFLSKLRETERQIGNAVPPVFAWHVAQSVMSCLFENTSGDEHNTVFNSDYDSADTKRLHLAIT